MEYFPYPCHSKIPPVVVPYLPEFEYDHLDFASFPERTGLSANFALDIHRPCQERAAFVQSWLYFGLMEVFFSQSVDKGPFISQGSAPSQVVNGPALNDVLLDAHKRFRWHTKWSSSFSAMRASLTVASRASRDLDQVQGDDQTLAAVLLSVKILIIVLAEFYSSTFCHENRSLRPKA